MSFIFNLATTEWYTHSAKTHLIYPLIQQKQNSCLKQTSDIRLSGGNERNSPLGESIPTRSIRQQGTCIPHMRWDNFNTVWRFPFKMVRCFSAMDFSSTFSPTTQVVHNHSHMKPSSNSWNRKFSVQNGAKIWGEGASRQPRGTTGGRFFVVETPWRKKMEIFLRPERLDELGWLAFPHIIQP